MLRRWLSDRHLTINSEFLRLVLADKGFDIADDLAMVGALLTILQLPRFTKGKPQREVEFFQQLFNIHIHLWKD